MERSVIEIGLYTLENLTRYSAFVANYFERGMERVICLVRVLMIGHILALELESTKQVPNMF